MSMGFFRQEYWSGLPFASPGDLPKLGIKPRSPTLQTDSLPTELCGLVVKNLSSNAGDPSLSSPGQWKKVPHPTEQLSLHTTARVCILKCRAHMLKLRPVSAAKSLSRVWLSGILRTVAHQWNSMSMEFSRQKYGSGLPCPPPEDLPNPGIEPRSLALQADSLSLSHQGSSTKTWQPYTTKIRK